MSDHLATERATYRRLLPSLLAQAGKFAVIHGETLIGTYVSYEDAVQIGYEHCGLNPFLVQQIASDETIVYFTRDFYRPRAAHA